jgi:hypothetical protein
VVPSGDVTIVVHPKFFKQLMLFGIQSLITTPWLIRTLRSEDSPAEQLMLTLSKSASSGIPASRIVQLIGSIQMVLVEILIDSDSSSSFVNQSLLSQLTDVQLLPAPSSVQVAGGGRLVCQSVLHGVPWIVDDCTLITNFSTLPLANFDVIIGMDWLEEHSPMQID